MPEEYDISLYAPEYLHIGLIDVSEWSTRARIHMRLANTYASGEDVEFRRFVRCSQSIPTMTVLRILYYHAGYRHPTVKQYQHAPTLDVPSALDIGASYECYRHSNGADPNLGQCIDHREMAFSLGQAILIVSHDHERLALC